MSTLEHIFQVIGQLVSGMISSGGDDPERSREVIGGAVDWAGQFLSLISQNTTLILFCIAIPLVGLGIGIIRRLVKVRA